MATPLRDLLANRCSLTSFADAGLWHPVMLLWRKPLDDGVSHLMRWELPRGTRLGCDSLGAQIAVRVPPKLTTGLVRKGELNDNKA
jgi:hypothetical protein